MAREDPDWSESLYERVRNSVNLALKACPDLSQSRDDLVQKVASRLSASFGEFQNRYLRDLMPPQGNDTWSGNISSRLEVLYEGLDEIGDWGRLKEIKQAIRRSVKLINKNKRTGEEFGQLSASLEMLRALGPNDIYAESYVRKNVLWAIQDARRARKPHHEGAESIDSGNQEEDDGALKNRQLARTASPERQLKLKLVWKRALREIDELTRNVVVLAGHGHKQIEIADLLGISLSTVERRLRKGRRILETKMREEGLET